MPLKPLGLSLLTRILSFFYGIVIMLRNGYYNRVPGSVKKLKHLTVSIGCIHAGGTGKTPMALLCAEHFSRKGLTPVFLTRGYKRKSSKPIIVRPGEEKSWENIGDEPAMLKKNLPDAWLGIGPDRFRNGRNIIENINNKPVFILDDAFQHRKLGRDIDVVCLPPEPFDDFLIPSGYLREPISSLGRADIICLIGLEKESVILERNRKEIKNLFPEVSVFILYQTIDRWINKNTSQTLQTCPFKSPVVVSGIARPYRFVELVSESGVTPYKIVNYKDHHAFKATEIEKLNNPMVDGIITTEKDIMRLSAINLVNCPNICYLKIKLRFSNSASEEKFFSLFNRKKTSLS